MAPKIARPSAPAVSAASTTPYKTTTSASGSAPRVAKNPNSNSSSSSIGGSSSSSFSSSTKSGNNAGLDEAQQIVNGIWDNYVRKTPQRTKLVDAFMAFLVLVGGLQFVYCVIVGNFVSGISLCCSLVLLGEEMGTEGKVDTGWDMLAEMLHACAERE